MSTIAKRSTDVIKEQFKKSRLFTDTFYLNSRIIIPITLLVVFMILGQ